MERHEKSKLLAFRPFTPTTQAQHKHEHKARLNRDDASTSASTRKRNALMCLRRPGSHVAYALHVLMLVLAS